MNGNICFPICSIFVRFSSLSYIVLLISQKDYEDIIDLRFLETPEGRSSDGLNVAQATPRGDFFTNRLRGEWACMLSN